MSGRTKSVIWEHSRHSPGGGIKESAVCESPCRTLCKRFRPGKWVCGHLLASFLDPGLHACVDSRLCHCGILSVAGSMRVKSEQYFSFQLTGILQIDNPGSLTGKPTVKRPLGRPRRRWEDYIRLYVSIRGIEFILLRLGINGEPFVMRHGTSRLHKPWS